jgi:hypothetical protein
MDAECKENGHPYNSETTPPQFGVQCACLYCPVEIYDGSDLEHIKYRTTDGLRTTLALVASILHLLDHSSAEYLQSRNYSLYSLPVIKQSTGERRSPVLADVIFRHPFTG